MTVLLKDVTCVPFLPLSASYDRIRKWFYNILIYRPTRLLSNERLATICKQHSIGRLFKIVIFVMILTLDMSPATP